jgi:hypothetical protein
LDLGGVVFFATVFFLDLDTFLVLLVVTFFTLVLIGSQKICLRLYEKHVSHLLVTIFPSSANKARSVGISFLVIDDFCSFLLSFIVFVSCPLHVWMSTFVSTLGVK